MSDNEFLLELKPIMANSDAIFSFAVSLQRFLDRGYRLAHPAAPAVPFVAIGGGWLAEPDEPVGDPTVTLYLHRLASSAHARNSRTCQAPGALVLDLHFLLSVWASSVENEQRLLGWAMEQLHHHAAFDPTVLTAEGGWGPAESVSIFPVEMATEEMARIFETVRRPARLSWPFVARVVRIETQGAADGPPVVVVREEFSTLGKGAGP